VIYSTQQKTQDSYLILPVAVPANQSSGMTFDPYNKKKNYCPIVSMDIYQLFDNPLSSAKKMESYGDRAFSYCIEDAINRYKQVNQVESYDTTSANPLLSELRSLSYKLTPHISFYEDAVKVSAMLNQREFIIDYDYENPEYIFISFFENDRLIIKERKITELLDALESF
jgi:hypothetical protein